MLFRKVALLIGAAALAGISVAPAQAQHQGHTMPMPQPKKPVPTKPTPKKPAPKKPTAKKAPPAAKKTPAKKPVAKKSAAKQRAVGEPAAKKPVDPHAGHAMPATADPHAGHQMPMPEAPAPATDPHGGHQMPITESPATTADPHAGHDMTAMPDMNMAPAGTNLPAGNSPPPTVPAKSAADAIYGEAAMDMGRHHLFEFHGGQKFFQVMLNVAEIQVRDGRDGFEWAGDAWYGGDINRLWLKTEGEGAFGQSLERAEVQTLYSHAIGPYFNLQGGLRYDFKPNPSRAYAAVGVEGLAPSFFDVEGTLFLSNKGELMARAEGYYDQRITQRLILQPRAELNFAAQSSQEIGVGAGLSDAEVGLRLRYDIRREFAPYVGLQYRRAFGRTREFLQDEGEIASSWSLLTGIRAWF